MGILLVLKGLVELRGALILLMREVAHLLCLILLAAGSGRGRMAEGRAKAGPTRHRRGDEGQVAAARDGVQRWKGRVALEEEDVVNICQQSVCPLEKALTPKDRHCLTDVVGLRHLPRCLLSINARHVELRGVTGGD